MSPIKVEPPLCRSALREGHRRLRNPKRRPKHGSAAWLVAALLVLSAIPLAAGAFRLTQLAGGAEITPANARFFAAPLPVVVHIVSAGVFAILGAFQFAPGFRRRWPGWHRVAGRLVVVCGLLVGLSGLWMTLFYPWPAGDGALLYVLRLLFGSAMVAVDRPRLYRDPATGRDGGIAPGCCAATRSGLARARRC